MAIIHQGKNENRETMNRYLEEEVQQAKGDYEKRVGDENRFYHDATKNAYEKAKTAYEEATSAYEAAKRSHLRRIPFRLLIILLCVGLIVLLVQHPRIVIQIQQKAQWLFTKLNDAVNTDAIMRLAPEIKASEKWDWVAQIANILIQLGLGILAMLCTAVLFLANLSIQVFIPVLFYVLLGVVALWHIAMLFIPPKLEIKQFAPQPFNLKSSAVKPVYAEFDKKVSTVYKEAQNAYEDAKNAYEEVISAYKAEKRSHLRRIPFRLLIILLCVGLIVLLTQDPRIIMQIQQKVKWFFARLSDAVSEDTIARLAPEIKASGKWELVAQIVTILIGVELRIFAMPCIVMLFLADISVRFLIPVLCYGLLGVVALWHIVMLFRPHKLKIEQFAPQPFKLKRSDVEPVYAAFDEKIAREVIMETLPDEWRILQSGLEGEEEALDLLSELENDFHIYTNLVIPYDGKTSETDLIVVAPHGVTIVEVKNYKDTLTGDWSDEHLWLKKERGRNNYTDQIYNPVRQVGTHVYRLSHYLSEHGVNAWVNSCVLFVNENIQLHQMTDENHKLQECPVFRYEEEDELFNYLRTPHPETSGSGVVPLLNKLIAQQT